MFRANALKTYRKFAKMNLWLKWTQQVLLKLRWLCLIEVGTGREMAAGWGPESIGMVGAEKPEELMFTKITGIKIKWDKMCP